VRTASGQTFLVAQVRRPAKADRRAPRYRALRRRHEWPREIDQLADGMRRCQRLPEL